MAEQSRWKQLLSGNISLSKTLHKTFSYISTVIWEPRDGEDKAFRIAMDSLLFSLLNTGGVVLPAARDVFRSLLEDRFDHNDIEQRLNGLSNCTPIPENEAVAELKSCDLPRQKQIIEFMFSLAVELGNDPGKIAFVKRIAAKLDLPENETDAVYERLISELNRKKRIISSGIGIVVAIVLLLIFILAAKYLQSVIFGLILACLLLPVEKFFERRLTARKGMTYILVRAVHFIMLPLRSLSGKVMRKSDTPPLTDAQKEKSVSGKSIRQATVMTLFATLLCIGIITAGLSFAATRYVKKINLTQVIKSANSSSQLDYYLERAKERFEKLPPVRSALEAVEKILKDPAAQEKFLTAALRHSGGVFAFTADMVGVVVSFAGNVLLTIFFTLLFLIKLAEFCNKGDSDKQKSEYFIRSVFNGVWLPAANEQTIREARRVIEGVFSRLRVWLKGYFTLVLVDSTVYTTLFTLLGVPFSLPLGILAGCGIILPYIGPFISCSVTILVTLAAGGATGSLLLSIIICYLIYNGIIEQFILYPAVIGEAIGLSTLETIIVVLLGAVFAGIPGMLLAMPAASVAKYIIPQLYKALPFAKMRVEKN